MLRPVRMQKLMVLATRNSESRVISALHRMGVMEITPLELPGLDKERPLEVHDELARELVRVRSLIAALGGAGRGQTPKISDADYSKALASASALKIDEEVAGLAKARSELSAEEKELEKKLAEISRLALFPEIDFSKLETKTFTFVLGSVKHPALANFKKDIEEYLPGSVQVLVAPAGKENSAVLIFYPRRENIEFILARYEFEKAALPENFSTFEKGKSDVQSRLAEVRASLSAVEKKAQELRKAHMPALLESERELEILSERASIAAKFSSGRKIFAISGWARKKDVPGLEQNLKKEFADEVELILSPQEEGAPVVLDNPKNISQFQWLVEFYSLPSYSEFDPTFILLFTVPIIYGMIVGDVGYGLISAILSLLILTRFKGGMLGNVARIWLFSSAASMVFGAVFDEWFGFPHYELAEWLKQWGLDLGIGHELYKGISRSHELSLVIGLTLLVGALHLALGFILGALNAWGHDRKHAAAKIAWLALLTGGSLMAASSLFQLLSTAFFTPALAVFALSAIAIGYFEGLPGIFEIPGIAANVFSYARIAAAGVAGVIIAEIINKIFLPTPGSLILFPIFILLHIINAALAMFESIVQGGRLNMVEFYSKFFQGGGKAFSPFRIADAGEGSEDNKHEVKK